MNVVLYMISSIYFISTVAIFIIFICDYFNRREEKISSILNDKEVL